MGQENEVKETKSTGYKLLEKINPYLKIYRNNRDIILTLYAAIWFFFCTYLVSLANSYADRINTNVNNTEEDIDYVAPDALLETANKFFTDNTWIPRSIADYLVRFTAGLIILRALTLKSYTLTVSRRILYVMGFVYLLRACFIPLTVLPTPWVTCKKDYKDNIFYDALLIVFQIRAACGDVFFSGHTIMFTLNIVEYWYYCKKIWINILITILNITGMYTLIMASYHYSIDVLCAFIFSVMFWAIYHWAISIPELGATWWGNIVNYFDDPLYYEHEELPLAYESNNNIMDDQRNISDITELSPQDKEKINQGTAINEVTLLYELRKEQEKNINIKNINKNNIDYSEEEYVYKRKSNLTDTSIDNISNMNVVNATSNNVIEAQPLTEEIIKIKTKKDKYLSPNYGNKVYKHHSLNSILSSSDTSATNVPSIMVKHAYLSSSNLSSNSSTSLSHHLSVGGSSTKSKTMSNSLQSLDHKIDLEKSSSSNSSSASDVYITNQDIIKEQIPINQPFEPSKDILKDNTSYYSESEIIKNDSKNDDSSVPTNISCINTKGVTQFKTKDEEIITVDSVHESLSLKSPTDITDLTKNN